MKTVFDNRQLAHVWASGSQGHGRNTNGSMYFQQSTIYSYGNHFPIARKHQGPNGWFVAVNSSSYSVTTSKHQNFVRQAVKHIEHVSCPNPIDLKDIENDNWYLNNITQALVSVWDSRIKNYSNPLSVIGDYNRFKHFRGDPRSKAFQLDAWTFHVTNALIREKLDAQLAREATIAANRGVKLRATKELYANQVNLWTTHQETERIPHDAWPDDYDLIRLAKVEPMETITEVETNRGARVPLTHAVRLLHLYINNKAVLKERVGHFTVDGITQDTIKIGCHTINIQQAKRVLERFL